MGLLDDDSLDERARPIILASKKQPVTEERLRRATLIEESPSPAMLEDTAEWLGHVEALAAGGFTPSEIVRLAIRATRDTVGVHGPDSDMLAHLLATDDGLAIARQLAEELLALTGEREFKHEQLANVALARLALAKEIEPRFDALFQWYPTEPSQLRAIFAALPPDRREALARARAKPNTEEGADTARSAAFILDKLLDIADLVPATSTLHAGLLAAAKGDYTVEKLAAEIATGTPRTIPTKPTPEALKALDYWLEKTKKAARAGDIKMIAEDAYARKITVDAPELATVAAWTAAGAKRQKQIAALVASTLGGFTEKKCSVVDISSFGGPPIAVIACGALRFCLVPGGLFEMGFSEEEEAAVRAQAEVNADSEMHFELYEQLFEQLDAMRPISHVRVGPLLVMQGPGGTYDLDKATDVLLDSPFRVPSEAEWEYLARGGKPRELTYRGDVVPDDESWFEETKKLGVKGANAFGLWGFGYQPELCADVYAETLDDVPSNGSPRRGDGERVVRGGAAQLYPWQSTGEWHMLLSAFRMPQSAWEFTLALRFVLGIECGAKRS